MEKPWATNNPVQVKPRVFQPITLESGIVYGVPDLSGEVDGDSRVREGCT